MKGVDNGNFGKRITDLADELHSQMNRVLEMNQIGLQDPQKLVEENREMVLVSLALKEIVEMVGVVQDFLSIARDRQKRSSTMGSAARGAGTPKEKGSSCPLLRTPWNNS